MQTLAEACAKTDWQVHAYCLMKTHFHLVVETPRVNLVPGMKWLLSTYTIRFNRPHKVSGHLFSGRYQALAVDGSGSGYLRRAFDYVHLNPVRAKLRQSNNPNTKLRRQNLISGIQSGPLRPPFCVSQILSHIVRASWAQRLSSTAVYPPSLGALLKSGRLTPRARRIHCLRLDQFTMRTKTYLAPAAQWQRSVALVATAPRHFTRRMKLGSTWHLGRISHPHRLFCKGDIVLVRISNGFAERQPVWGVSSKGYAVRDFYLQYSRSKKSEMFEGGPLRFVELPGHLVDKTPDDPDVRRFVVETLRAGDSAVG